MLDSHKGVLSLLLFIVNISGSQHFCWREPNPDLRFFWRASQKFLTQFNWHVLFHSRTKSVRQNIRLLLKDCWGPHKGCLEAECGPQKRVWEPLVYMNWIDSHSRVHEGVTLGSCRINRWLFADDLVLLASSQQSSTCTRSVFCCVRPRRNEN